MKINNIRTKTIASIEQRNDESLNICYECGCIIEGDYTESEGNLYCPDCADQYLTECEHCGKFFRTDDMTETTDGMVCNDCLDENYSYCEQCEQWVPDDEVNVAPNDNFVCDNCLDNHNGYMRCEHCGEIVSTDNTWTVYIDNENTEEWCAHCQEWHSFYCEECNETYAESSVTRYEDICEYCYENQQNIPQRSGNIDTWEAPRGIKGYSYKPDPCFCMTEEQKKNCTFAQLVHFGFELEMEYHGRRTWEDYDDANYLNDNIGFTYCKHDGSLSDYGLELVSHPATFEFLMEKKPVFEEVFNHMIHKGYTSHKNGNCGLHVHISAKPMIDANPYAINNLYILVNHVFWDKLVHFSRRTEYQLNRWAKRYSESRCDPKEIVKEAKCNCGRYMAVNLENTHTVELRMFRGTLKVETFIATIQLIKRLVDLSLSIEEPQDAYNATWKQLLDCDYKELKAYCAKRFAEKEEDSSNDETSDNPELAAPTFTISKRDMHRANLRVGDEIEFVYTPYIRDEFIGATGVIESIGDEYYTIRLTSRITNSHVTLFSDGNVVTTALRHADQLRRITPTREGDYVYLEMDFVDYQNNRNSRSLPYMTFSRELNAGQVGIVWRTNIDCNDINSAAVEFADYFRGCHDCSGSVPSRNGQYIDITNLTLI